MMFPILAAAVLTMALNSRVGFPPFPLVVTVRTAETGPICVVIEGPESHLSCWVKQPSNPAIKLRGDPPVKAVKFTLGVPGEYIVWAELRRKKHAEMTVIVLGE